VLGAVKPQCNRTSGRVKISPSGNANGNSAGTGAPVSRNARILCGTVGRFNLEPGHLGINRSCVEERGLQRLPFDLESLSKLCTRLMQAFQIVFWKRANRIE
jgi:hypothetical protein